MSANDIGVNALIAACKALTENNVEEGKNIIQEKYPHQKPLKSRKSFTKKEQVTIFLRDGFIDRYSGDRLIFPGVLCILSHIMPDVFPYFLTEQNKLQAIITDRIRLQNKTGMRNGSRCRMNRKPKTKQLEVKTAIPVTVIPATGSQVTTNMTTIMMTGTMMTRRRRKETVSVEPARRFYKYWQKGDKTYDGKGRCYGRTERMERLLPYGRDCGIEV